MVEHERHQDQHQRRNHDRPTDPHGRQPAIDPTNPDIIYSSLQQCSHYRVDRIGLGDSQSIFYGGRIKMRISVRSDNGGHFGQVAGDVAAAADELSADLDTKLAEQGKPDHPGVRSWSVSGRVKEPGVKLAPAGVTVRELIDDYCGGMADGHSFKAYLPGGASGGILPASMDDIALDFGDTLFKHGAFVGSHAVVILSDQDNIKDAVINLIDFFAHESCGQCTPCRGGTEKLTKLLRKPGKLDEETIRDLEQVMRDASICGLGQAAPNPVNHLLTHFRGDL